jgi:hypothetical protein
MSREENLLKSAKNSLATFKKLKADDHVAAYEEWVAQLEASVKESS